MKSYFWKTPALIFEKLQRIINAKLQIILVLMMVLQGQSVLAANNDQTKFKRIPTQFIAALADPDASEGDNAQLWGVWRQDPGPRGVWLKDYEQLKADGNLAPAQWQYDGSDWWLEENGLIMEQPDFPLPAGKYMVTGDREVVSVLTVHPKDENGAQHWELGNGANLYDVTHLKCRSARYTPALGEDSCSPAKAPQSVFRVAPGAEMPPVEGCNKQDYAVLFIVALEVEN